MAIKYKLLRKVKSWEEYEKKVSSRKHNKPTTKYETVAKLRKMSYRQFLKSRYWVYVRQLVLARDNNTCTVCGGKKHLQIHHLNYDHHLTEHKHLEDLVTLCHSCHKSSHELT
jgi:5-methylcytosine-specific restriction endonuclease McrA